MVRVVSEGHSCCVRICISEGSDREERIGRRRGGVGVAYCVYCHMLVVISDQSV